MSLKNKISGNTLPQHIAIIMDGNGRWAKKKGNVRLFGHKNGAKAVDNTVEACVELGIKYLTLYAFSTENWNRPQKEVEGLMTLLTGTIEKELDKLIKYKVKLKIIGDTNLLPPNVKKKLDAVIEATENNSGLVLTLALSYSSRWEITEAVKKIASDTKNGKLQVNSIDSETINTYLNTSGYPEPELLIRTSGEYRISNFLLWQIAYTELYFTDTLWPDFNKEELYKAIYDYQQRERRFGKTGEQISNEI